MKYLITGAHGFVGSLLCDELVRQGQSVRAALRTAQSSTENIEIVVVGEIDGKTVWTDALRGVDVIIHLAARVHVMKESAPDPQGEFFRVNLYGTENLARQAAQAGIRRLVYVSSIGVNGNRTNGMQAFSENDTPHPHNAYAVSKWQAERALHHIARDTGLEIVVVRPPLVYGPGAKGNFISLLAAVGKGMPLPLAGVRNTRSLVYVGNLVSALIACATHPAAAGQTYLVRDGEDVSTPLLARKIAKALGRNCRLFYVPHGLLRVIATVMGRSEQIDKLIGSLRVNDEKILSELGWIPPYTLAQGLLATADWYSAYVSKR